MSLKPVTVLRRARKLIADPKSWIKGAFTRKRKGVQYYCGLGALAVGAGIKIVSPKRLSDEVRLPQEYYDAHELLNRAAQTSFFPYFNDAGSTTHKQVLEAFDRAIALAKG